MKFVDYFKKGWFGTQKVTKSGKRSDSSKKEDLDIDTSLILKFFKSDPIINAAVWVTVDNIVSGFKVVPDSDDSTDERDAEEATRLLQQDDFMEKLRNVAANMILFSNCYQEAQTFMDNGSLAFQSFMLETSTIKPEVDSQGEIKAYVQRIDGKIVARLDPKEIIHYKINTIGDRDLGLSSVESIMYSSAMRKFIDKYNASIFQNHKPRGAWIFSSEMDDDTYNDNVDLIVEAKNNPNKDIFLRGSKDQIGFEPFMKEKEGGFVELMKSARDEIVTGLMVPPILLGLPEGSNRANSDIQLQGFDRRVAAIQAVINKQITREILRDKFNMPNVKFQLSKANKRDEERELNIVNKMQGLITMNEARMQLGLPELDETEYPESTQIWKTGSTPESTPQFEKSVKFEKVKKNEVLVKPKLKETEAGRILNTLIDEIEKKTIEEIVKTGVFEKAIKPNQVDPEIIANAAYASIGIDQLTQQFGDLIKRQYMQGNDEIGVSLSQNIIPSAEELKFIEKYSFDLIKGLTDDLKNKITSALRRGVMEGLSVGEVTQEIITLTGRSKTSAEAIARTELSRSNNMGQLNGIKNSGVEAKKYLVFTDDDRTSDVSRKLNKKYGKPEQAIPLDEEFKVTVKGKVIKGLAPPFHINDRDSLVFTT